MLRLNYWESGYRGEIFEYPLLVSSSGHISRRPTVLDEAAEYVYSANFWLTVVQVKLHSSMH